MRPTVRWLDPWREAHAVKTIWTALADACHPTYFLRWAWIENWLATLPRGLSVRLATISDDAGPIAAWFVGERVIFHGGILPSRARFLNATGWEEFDDLTIEHNQWLERAPNACSIDLLVDALGSRWDELVMDGMIADGAALTPRHPTRIVLRKEVACYTVDLDKVRAVPDYLSLISADSRSQIRRSMKLYAARGEPSVEIAADLTRAREIFTELVTLHTAVWTHRGKTGAFSPFMRRFHDRLIDERFERGEIQLVRVRFGDVTIGCLYNLVCDGVVSFYQSGMAYEPDNKLKPGLVCHTEAIRFNAAAGHRVYDFLGGDAQYKKSLATDSSQLSWATLRRPRKRFALEGHARDLRAWWRRER
jgi:hypothetical protein